MVESWTVDWQGDSQVDQVRLGKTKTEDVASSTAGMRIRLRRALPLALEAQRKSRKAEKPEGRNQELSRIGEKSGKTLCSRRRDKIFRPDERMQLKDEIEALTDLLLTHTVFASPEG